MIGIRLIIGQGRLTGKIKIFDVYIMNISKTIIDKIISYFSQTLSNIKTHFLHLLNSHNAKLKEYKKFNNDDDGYEPSFDNC